MEDSTTDTEQEEEEEKGGKAQEDPIYAIAPTINIQDERFVDLSTTPAFICMHEHTRIRGPAATGCQTFH